MSKYVSTKLFGDDFLMPVGGVRAGGSLGYAVQTDSNFIAILIDKDHVEELLRVFTAGEVMGSDVACEIKRVVESALEDDETWANV